MKITVGENEEFENVEFQYSCLMFDRTEMLSGIG